MHFLHVPLTNTSPKFTLHFLKQFPSSKSYPASHTRHYKNLRLNPSIEQLLQFGGQSTQRPEYANVVNGQSNKNKL